MNPYASISKALKMQCLKQSALRGLLLVTQRGFAIRKSAAGAAVSTKKKRTSSDDDPDEHQQRGEAMRKLAESVNKTYGRGTMTVMSSRSKIERYSSELMSLDLMLGGGIPKGRVVEIYGPEGSGKTTLAIHLLAAAQKPDNLVEYVDTEYALNPEYAKAVGLNLDKCYITQPDSGEDAFKIMLDSIRARVLSAICIDSVASLVPQVEIEGEFDDAQMALQARMMAKGMRNVTQANSTADMENAVTLIFINQLRSKVGLVFGNPEVRPGGKALPYHASVSLDVRASTKLTGLKGEIIGHKLKVKVVKNKIAAPHRIVELDLIYGQGLCRVGSLLDAAVPLEVISANGPYFKFDGEMIGQGRSKTVERLKQDPALMSKIEDATKAAFEKKMDVSLTESPPSVPYTADESAQELETPVHSASEEERDAALDQA